MNLLRRIERHMRRHGLSPTRLGRAAAGDPRFVLDLRLGRTPRPETAARVLAWLGRERRRRPWRG